MGSFSCMAFTSNVLLPKVSGTFMPPASSGSERMLRDMTSPMAQTRPVTSPIACLLLGKKPALYLAGVKAPRGPRS